MNNHYIYLRNINKYVQESNNEDIWLLTDDINDAFTDTDFLRTKRIALFISEDKHIPLHDIIIEEEIIKIEVISHNLDSDYLQCSICMEWNKQEDLVEAKYSYVELICPQCKGEE